MGCRSAFELAPANVPERQVAAEMLERVALEGYTVIADKGFAGEEFETHMASLGARFLRPDRNNEPRRNGSLGPVRQWIESVIWTCKGQLALERHGGRTLHRRLRPRRAHGCSPSPPASSITTTSVTQAATSPPTATDSVGSAGGARRSRGVAD